MTMWRRWSHTIDVPENGERIEMQAGDRAVVIRLLKRLDAGQTFEHSEDLAAMPYKIGSLSRIGKLPSWVSGTSQSGLLRQLVSR